MTLETIYILRHGFRANWLIVDWKSPTGLPRDPQLAAFGEVQAREVADHFQSLPDDQRPTAIFSSPYYRCLQTSRPTAITLGVPVYVEHGLSEWYYPVEPGTGLHPRSSSASALKAHFPEIDDSWSSVWYPSRQGEGVAALHDRLAGFLNVFVPELQRRLPAAHRRILLVSHAATIIALTRELVGDRNLLFQVACCSLTSLDRKDHAAGDSTPLEVGNWTARLLGDGTHLKEGLQRPWGFRDLAITNGEVIEEPGIPGTENEKDEPVGSQIIELSSRM
ncbi:histidine phosphatase superfamily [Russula earlei]|uniref:Histidine phosphatase superfamily n=1 Tax=Russula earlei TaxID=71964 RepID=A0ACC0TYS1_9AGAM|nr:histidine phosphatase superfamily [Russula earlei]